MAGAGGGDEGSRWVELAVVDEEEAPLTRAMQVGGLRCQDPRRHNN